MNVLAFGEILFDCYPTDEKIGGAPFNFGAHLAQLGANSYLYSAVGNDNLGKKALETALFFGVDTRYIQTSKTHPTGICKVSYQGDTPTYDLSRISAYDAISFQPLLPTHSFDLLYFGTLALREEHSEKTWEQLLSDGKFGTVFFDINLRQHYFSKETVEKGLVASDIVKMNREEFAYVKEISATKSADNQTALQKISTLYGIKTAILTLDKEGACVYDKENGFFFAPPKETRFVSAVGAGDSFCACFLYHLFHGASILTALDKASTLSSYVVSREEAVPAYPDWLKQELKSV